MSKKNKQQGISFQVSTHSLYREEAYTDMNSASVRKLIPVKPDGSDDTTREIRYVGHADLISPSGPIPIQADLEADNLKAALANLPRAMEAAATQVRNEYNTMMQQQQQQQEQQSKVIKSTD